MSWFKRGDEDKGLDCSVDPETGEEYCRVMSRHRNKKLATGSDFSVQMGEDCKARPGKWSVFSDDEALAHRKLKQAEAECKRGRQS